MTLNKKIPISLVVAENDKTCNSAFAGRIFGEVGDTKKYLRIEADFEHEDFVTASGSEYMQRILSTIEFGNYPKPEYKDSATLAEETLALKASADDELAMEAWVRET